MLQMRPTLPSIVNIVLRQVSHQRREGTIKDAEFGEKLSRLSKQELQPPGLLLQFEELPGGRTRFVTKSLTSGEVRHTLEYTVEDLGTMVFEMQAAIHRDGYYVATAPKLEMLWGGQQIPVSEKLRVLHKFARIILMFPARLQQASCRLSSR